MQVSKDLAEKLINALEEKLKTECERELWCLNYFPKADSHAVDIEIITTTDPEQQSRSNYKNNDCSSYYVHKCVKAKNLDELIKTHADTIKNVINQYKDRFVYVRVMPEISANIDSGCYFVYTRLIFV